MADDADVATANTEFGLAARLSQVSAVIPPGVAGECDECGEHMPRLVGGLCAFCRDGRRPPLATYDRLQPVVSTAAERSAMTKKVITFTAEGRVRTAIERMSIERDLGWGPATLWLLNDYLDSRTERDGSSDEALRIAIERAERAEQEVADLRTEMTSHDGELSDIATEELIGELGRRVTSCANPEELQAANERAAAAEAKLAAVTAALR